MYGQNKRNRERDSSSQFIHYLASMDSIIEDSFCIRSPEFSKLNDSTTLL